MGELATAREDTDRYLKDGFKLTSRPMVDRLTEVIVDLERQVTLPERLGDSGWQHRLCRARFGPNDLSSGGTGRRDVERSESGDSPLPKPALGFLLDYCARH